MEEAIPKSSKKIGLIIGAIAIFFIFFMVAGGSLAAYLYFTNPKQVLAATTKKIDRIKSFHFTMDMKMSMPEGEITSKSSGDFDLPDKFQMKINMDMKGEELIFEERVLKDKTFMKMPEPINDWIEIPFGSDFFQQQQSTSSSANPNEFLSYLKAFSKVKKLDTQKIRGIDCYHYSVDINPSKLSDVMEKNDDKIPSNKLLEDMYKNSKMNIEVWIGKADKLPYREKINITVSSPEKIVLQYSIDFYDYDKKVEIKAPENAKNWLELLEDEKLLQEGALPES